MHLLHDGGRSLVVEGPGKARTILVSHRLADGYRRLLVGILEHENLGKFDSEPNFRSVMRLGAY